MSIKAIHAIRAQRKLEAAARNANQTAKDPPLYLLIARKSSFKEVLELKLKKDPFEEGMPWFRRLQKVLCDVMGHPITEATIMGFILGNTVILALYHEDMSLGFERILDVLNMVTTLLLYLYKEIHSLNVKDRITPPKNVCDLFYSGFACEI